MPSPGVQRGLSSIPSFTPPAFSPSTTQFRPPGPASSPLSPPAMPGGVSPQDQYFLRQFGLDPNNPLVPLLMAQGVDPAQIKRMTEPASTGPITGAPGMRSSDVRTNQIPPSLAQDPGMLMAPSPTATGMPSAPLPGPTPQAPPSTPSTGRFPGRASTLGDPMEGLSENARLLAQTLGIPLNSSSGQPQGRRGMAGAAPTQPTASRGTSPQDIQDFMNWMTSASGRHPSDQSRIDSRQPTTADVMFNPARQPSAMTPAPTPAVPATTPAAAATAAQPPAVQTAAAGPAAPPPTVPTGPAASAAPGAQPPAPPVPWRNPDATGAASPGLPAVTAAGPRGYQFSPVNPETGLPGSNDPVRSFAGSEAGQVMAAALEAPATQAPDGAPLAADEEGTSPWANPELWAALTKAFGAMGQNARFGGAAAAGAFASSAGDSASRYTRYETSRQRESRRDRIADRRADRRDAQTEFGMMLDMAKFRQDPVVDSYTAQNGTITSITQSGQHLPSNQKAQGTTKAKALELADDYATVTDRFGNDTKDDARYEQFLDRHFPQFARKKAAPSVGGQESPLGDSGTKQKEGRAALKAIMSQATSTPPTIPKEEALNSIAQLHRGGSITRKKAEAALKRLGLK